MFEFLDIESSGLHEESYPIEIGFTLGEKSHSYLIKRPPEWSFWDEISEQCYHNISREELDEKGLSPLEVVTLMNELLVGQVLYTDSYPFDEYWLRKLYSYVKIEMTFKLVDFAKLTADYGISDYSFFELKEELNDMEFAHRAAYDAQLNKEVMKKLINK
jgi:DNA polymerase III alpha subunit (gram-positive type)